MLNISRLYSTRKSSFVDSQERIDVLDQEINLCLRVVLLGCSMCCPSKLIIWFELTAKSISLDRLYKTCRGQAFLICKQRRLQCPATNFLPYICPLSISFIWRYNENPTSNGTLHYNILEHLITAFFSSYKWKGAFNFMLLFPITILPLGLRAPLFKESYQQFRNGF